jgi:hypothetical protein
MKNILGAILALFTLVSIAHADSVLIIDAGYSTVTANVKGRIEAAGHTTTVTTDVSLIPTNKNTYQQVWDLRYSAALTAGEQTNYQAFVTNGGFAYFVTENPGCCMARNNSVAALITALGGGTTTIGANYNTAADVESNVNTTYMTSGITVNYAAVSAIINSQGIPLIQDGTGDVSGMSWIGRAGNLGQGVTGTIVTVADTNWLDNVRFSTAQGATLAQQQNVTALDDIIRGIVAGTVGGTISANGNGAAASNGGGAPPPPTVVTTAAGPNAITSTTTYGNATTANVVVDGRNVNGKNLTVTRTTTPVTTTPFTNTVTTTPSTVTTYSDGSTVTANGTPVTSSTTGTVTNIGTSTSQSKSISATGNKDAIAHRNMNLFLTDPLSTKDGVWAAPVGSIGGKYVVGGAALGYQNTVDGNSFGFAITRVDGDSKGYVGSKTTTDSTGGNAYILTRQEYLWLKGSIGYSSSNHQTNLSIPEFALMNKSNVSQKNYYADIGIYSPEAFYGFRPLAGLTVNRSDLKGSETGSPLLSTLPPNGAVTKTSPYFGTRYEFDKNASVEARVINNTDYKTILSNRFSVNQEIIDNVSVNATVGFDKNFSQEKYTNTYGLVGLKWSF